MPDIDIDFCMNRRGEVIEYVKQKYGEDQVAQDHHLQHDGCEGCDQGRWTRAGHAVRRGRSHCKIIPATIGITIDHALKDLRNWPRRMKTQDPRAD